MSNFKKMTIQVYETQIGLNVRRMRELKGLSQSDLGEPLGITFQQVQKYENGQNRISAGKLPVIAELLGCKAADLVHVDDEKGKSPLADMLEELKALRDFKRTMRDAFNNWEKVKN